jgi:hypothetical protein
MPDEMQQPTPGREAEDSAGVLALAGRLPAEMRAFATAEIAAMRAEMAANVQRTIAGIAYCLAGAVALVLASLVLVAAAILALVALGLAPWLAATLVALVAGLAGTGLLAAGRASLRGPHLLPGRSLKRLRRDLHLIRKALTHEHA